MTLTLADRWLLHQFSTLCVAGASLQHDHMVDWLSHTWCRWAIELEKPVLYDTLHRDALGGCVASSRAVLAHVTARLMRILVPWAPALAEDIWHNLPPACRGSYRSVLQVPWPEAMGSFPNEARAVALAIEVLTALQELRSDAHLGPLEHLPQVGLVGDPQQCAELD
ncbi:MAG: class I tRNA ligase family protein, partial [Myxococcota bacterium]